MDDWNASSTWMALFFFGFRRWSNLMTIGSHYLTNIMVRLIILRHVRAMEQSSCSVTGFWGVSGYSE